MICAVAVDDASVPLSGVLVTDTELPDAGDTVTVTVPPVGTPVAVSSTVTGFGVFAGIVMSP